MSLAQLRYLFCRLLLTVTLLTTAGRLAIADEPNIVVPPAAPVPETTKPDEPEETAEEEPISPEIAEIQKAIQSYVVAFNRHDAQAVASHWSADGEFITPSGNLIQGRANLEKEFTDYFTAAKDAKLTLGELSIQLISPGVAVEHGSALVEATDQDPIETDYEAVHVKTAAGWKMDSVRETAYVPEDSHHEQLKALQWLIGTWIDADDEGVIETNCQWTKNQNFITRSFKVAIGDEIDLEGTQVIGWDPSINKIRSWMFDSKGGFGVGVWSQSDDRWTVKSLHILPDGKRGSITTVMQPVDENTMTMHTIGREVDGELLPNIGPIKVIRK